MKQIEYTPAGYWDRRYREGRTSGAGSEGDEGAYKAAYLSDFIAEHDVQSVVDWGCGDGQVLELVDLHGARYFGVDVSRTVIERVRPKYSPEQYSFFTTDSFREVGWLPFDVALSFDVLFHFPDDDDYEDYLTKLFQSADKYVMIYATNYAGGRTARHVFRREFTPDIAERFPDWKLTTVETPLRDGLASFFVYEKVR